MKQIKLNDGQVFGPFEQINITEDRYDCGPGELHLCFTVVGNDCVIEDYVPPPEPEPAPETPQA